MSVALKIVAAVAATATTFWVLVGWRGFFIQHAALVSLAVGALVYTTLGTTQRLGRTYRRKGPRSLGRRPPDGER